MKSCGTLSPSKPRLPGVGTTLGLKFPALLATLCLAVLVGCGRSSDPTEVSLAELAERPAAYNGRVVRTRGTVRGFDDPRHYWLEDENMNRVGLIPVDRVAPHLGRQITVLGQFSYARDQGRRLRVGTIEAYHDQR